MKNKKLSTSIIVLLLFGLVFGVSMVALSLRNERNAADFSYLGNGDNRSYDKVYPVQNGGVFKINADVGSITVTGTDKQEVSIHAIADGSEKMMKRFEISSTAEGNTVIVRAKLQNKYFQWFNDNSINVHFEIQVPKEFTLNLQTSGGDIDIRNVKGRIDGETSGGDLMLDQLDGNIRLTTSGGDVRAKNLSGTITLETSGGGITGENLAGPIMVETSGGNIDLKSCDGKVHASTSGGDVRLVASDNKGIDLSTSGGNVTLRLPKSVGADVTAETTGGDVSCDFPINGKLRDGSLHGKINGGGNSVRLETSGGEIVISPTE